MSTTLSAEISKAVSERGCLRTGLEHRIAQSPTSNRSINQSNQSRQEVVFARAGNPHVDQRAHRQSSAGAARALDAYRAVDLGGIAAGAPDGDVAVQVDAVDQHRHPASDLLREPPRADLRGKLHEAAAALGLEFRGDGGFLQRIGRGALDR